MGVTDFEVCRIERRTRDVGSWHYDSVQAHPSPSPGSPRPASRSGDPSRSPATLSRRDGVAL